MAKKDIKKAFYSLAAFMLVLFLIGLATSSGTVLLGVLFVLALIPALTVDMWTRDPDDR